MVWLAGPWPVPLRARCRRERLGRGADVCFRRHREDREFPAGRLSAGRAGYRYLCVVSTPAPAAVRSGGCPMKRSCRSPRSWLSVATYPSRQPISESRSPRSPTRCPHPMRSNASRNTWKLAAGPSAMNSHLPAVGDPATMALKGRFGYRGDSMQGPERRVSATPTTSSTRASGSSRNGNTV